MLKITDSASAIRFLVKTRLPFAAWALAGGVTLFSLASSMAPVAASWHNVSASLARAAGLATAGCDKTVVTAAVLH
jgi:hypothetical protein